jgi:hypothetical protein
MFIELAGMLRCPGDHERMPCVVAPDEMDGRRVVRGTIGCPVCEAEYSIVEGVVGLGEDPLLGAGSRSDDLTVEEMPSVDAVRALLNLSSPGGYVAVVGSGSRLADGLSENAPGVHFIGINPPPELGETPDLSLLRSPNGIPLIDSSVRGVLLGREYVLGRWMDEAGRILAPAGRLVAVADDLSAQGVRQVVVGQGMWVGEKETV